MKSTTRIAIITVILLAACTAMAAKTQKAAKKTVYASYILHGNMNYDRYVRPTIWEEFPKIYDNLLVFMDEHPDFKGQVQFSGQTFGSLKQCAPDVVEHAMAIHRRGQLNLTGTFYSEPVNVNMDGRTNFRCAWLGTKIIEDALGGPTDGFYLQERAYHAQLPWILKNAGVSWIPVITGNPEDWFPFSLVGMDGSKSICVPITRHGEEFFKRLESAPKNSLLLIEEDYEIPQSFVSTYDKLAKFNAEHNDIEVKWITVKDYIAKFGVKGERRVDHSAKAHDRINGTYSRWTADPLDIIVQDKTNQAMEDMRSAMVFNALVRKSCGFKSDIPLAESTRPLIPDPLAWNIERADLYPEIEPKFLKRDGEVTLLSRAEHLLLWAVNSDGKGWFPLYEKRRERMASLQGCRQLSREVIDRAIDHIANGIKTEGYDKCYVVANMETRRKKPLTLSTPYACEAFDCETGRKLPAESVWNGESFDTEILADLPSFGYTTIGIRRIDNNASSWKEGAAIEKGGIRVEAKDGGVIVKLGEKTAKLSLEPFKVKFLGEVTGNDIDGVCDWRDAKPYGKIRTAIRGGQTPVLQIDCQPDWYVHLRGEFRIVNGEVLCNCKFEFPHPTLVRHDLKAGNNFDPRGLDLKVETSVRGKVLYDMPFGIASSEIDGDAYLCPLSTIFLQGTDGGIIINPRTGEQAFSVCAKNGEATIHLGASTTSGPAKDLGLEFSTPTSVQHKTAWYAEPFHGSYVHNIALKAYDGQWNEAHAPASVKAGTAPVYVRECSGKGNGKSPLTKSLLGISDAGVEVFSADCTDAEGFTLQLNETEGRSNKFGIRISDTDKTAEIGPFGIKSLSL